MSILNYPLQIALGASLVANAGLAVYASHEHHRASDEAAGRKADKISYDNAQTKAAANALVQKAQKEKIDAERASKADASNIALRDKYNAAILRHQAAQRAASHAHMSEIPSPAFGGHGPSTSSDLPELRITQEGDNLLVISLSDAKICATNTARLQAVQKWAVDPIPELPPMPEILKPK